MLNVDASMPSKVPALRHRALARLLADGVAGASLRDPVALVAGAS